MIKKTIDERGKKSDKRRRETANPSAVASGFWHDLPSPETAKTL
jgi:hypothetical protein